MMLVALTNAVAFGLVTGILLVFIKDNPDAKRLKGTRSMVIAVMVSFVMLLANIFFTGAMVWR